ncbi:MAG: hypothetical protein O7C75_12880, partial [Verrucomicrobia bacterium]|nr:hypothetical protein [Verrucomicrobiota bacterium]
MSISLRKIIHFRAALSTMKGLMFGMIFSWWVTPAQGQEIQAYAKPKEDYTYIYTLDHEYETTLFRSEKFDPIEETEEGYVILLQLAGNPKLVLLP